MCLKEIDDLLRLKEQFSGPTAQALNAKVKELESMCNPNDCLVILVMNLNCVILMND